MFGKMAIVIFALVLMLASSLGDAATTLVNHRARGTAKVTVSTVWAKHIRILQYLLPKVSYMFEL